MSKKDAGPAAPTELITRQADLVAHCARWRDQGALAFDTEFIRDDTYEARLCLVQAVGAARTDGQVVLIDPTAPEIDLTPFWALVTDPDITAIVHAGKEDFEVCLRASGKPPRNVFDIQIAAGFVGLGYPLSLTRIVELLLHKKLHKGQTLTDWAIRPLTDEQLRYAVEDVVHLPRIYDKLNKELVELQRVDWAREEFARFELPETYIPPVDERVAKLKGTKHLDGLGLLVLEKLVAWRDAWAQEKNRPVRALIRDDVLVEVARRRPRRAQELAVLRGFPQSRNARIVTQVLELIEECRQIPKSQWPQPQEIREESPMHRATVDLLSAVARALSYENRISHDLVGSTQRLRELIDYDLRVRQDPPPLLRGWRNEFVGAKLLDLLQGRSEVHLSGWPEDPRLEVIADANTPPAHAEEASAARKRTAARAKKANPKSKSA